MVSLSHRAGTTSSSRVAGLLLTALGAVLCWWPRAPTSCGVPSSRELAVARLQSDFVAAVSHEFRTPLTSLRQFTDMLREKPRSTTSGAASLRRAVARDRAADAARRVAARLRPHGGGRTPLSVRAARLHRPGAAVSSTIFATRQPRSWSCDRFPRQWRRRRSRSTTRRCASGPESARQRREVFAGAAADRGGRRAARWRTCHCRAAIAASAFRRSEQTAIFAKFHRGEQARTRGIKGTGIGLAMVRRDRRRASGARRRRQRARTGQHVHDRAAASRADGN